MGTVPGMMHQDDFQRQAIPMYSWFIPILRDVGALLGLLWLTCILLGPVALHGDLPLDTDTLLFFYPLRAAHTDESLGLWNPYLFGGMPRDANPQAQLLYPPNAVFSFLSAESGYAFLLVFHYWLGGVGVYFWLRRMQCTSLAAFTGAVAFLCNTYWRCKITNLGLLEAVAWVPWVLLSFTRPIENQRWLDTLLCMIPLALMILVGVPHIVVYTALLMLLWVLCVTAFRPLHWRTTLVHFCSTWMGALLLTAGMWLPALLYLPDSIRGPLPLDEALKGSISLVDFWKVFWGGMSQPDLTRAEPWEGTGYAGATALLLALIGLCKLPRSLRWTTVVIFTIGLLLSLGSAGGLFVLLHTWVPGWSSINLPNRALLLCSIVLPLWIAFGADALCNWTGITRARSWGLYATSAILLGLVAIACVLIPSLPATIQRTALTATFDPERVLDSIFALLNSAMWLGITLPLLLLMIQRTIKPVVGISILVTLIAIQSIQYNQRLFLQTIPADELRTIPVVQELQQNISPPGRLCSFMPQIDIAADVRCSLVFDALMYRLPEANRLRDIQGYDPLMPRRYADLVRTWAGQNDSSENPRTIRVDRLPESLLCFMGVNTILGHPERRILYRGSMRMDEPGLLISGMEEPQTVSAIHLRSVLLRAGLVQHMTPVGEVRVYSSTEEYQAYPIRAGVESANQFTQYGKQFTRHRAAPVFRWIPIPSPFGYERAQQYHTTITLPEPVRAESVGIALHHSGISITVLELTYDQADIHLQRNWKKQPGQPVWIRKVPEETAYLSTDIREFTSLDEMIPTLDQSTTAQPPVFVHQSPPNITAMDTLNTSLSLERPDSDTIRIQYNSPHEAMLVIRETWSPYWTAKLAGQTPKTLRVNETQIGVQAPAGSHEIILTYEPTPYSIGLAISRLSLLCLIMGIGYSLYTRQKRSVPAS